MRDRSKTIESLRRVAERPGSPNEGEMARRLLAQLGVMAWTPKPFEHYPKGTRVFYCYWCYRNDAATVASSEVKQVRGEKWMLLKFDRIKRARWVPVTSSLGFHLGLEPFSGDVGETLYRMNLDWKRQDDELAALLRRIQASKPAGVLNRR